MSCDGMQGSKGSSWRLTTSLGPRRPNLPAQIRGAGHGGGWDGERAPRQYFEGTTAATATAAQPPPGPNLRRLLT